MSTSPSFYFLQPHKNNRNPQILRNSHAPVEILATTYGVRTETAGDKRDQLNRLHLCEKTFKISDYTFSVSPFSL